MDRTLSDRIFPPVLLLLALAWLLPWMPAHAEVPAEWVALPLSERVVDATHTLDEATRNAWWRSSRRWSGDAVRRSRW